MSLLQDFLNFVEQLRPGQLKFLRGASPEQISRFEALSHTQFPPIVQEYLARMGGCNGMVFDDTGSADVADLIEVCEDAIRENEPFQNGIILLAYGETIQNLVLNIQENAEDPPVYLTHEATPEIRYAAHFTHFLHRQALTNLAGFHWPCHATLRLMSPGVGLADVRAALPRLGLEPYFFSDDCVVCAHGADGMLVADHINRPRPPLLWLDGSQSFVEKVRTAFGTEVRFQRLPD